jgi:hypothetical protein
MDNGPKGESQMLEFGALKVGESCEMLRDGTVIHAFIFLCDTHRHTIMIWKENLETRR